MVELSALVTTLAEAYAIVAEEAGKRLEVQVAPDQRLHGDAALLRQMLTNLMDNALTHGGQTLRVALRPGPVLEVADDGPGVPAELRDTLFQPFVTGKSEGIGLGLAIARDIMRQLGGDLLHEDIPDGTRFTMTMPAA